MASFGRTGSKIKVKAPKSGSERLEMVLDSPPPTAIDDDARDATNAAFDDFGNRSGDYRDEPRDDVHQGSRTTHDDFYTNDDRETEGYHNNNHSYPSNLYDRCDSQSTAETDNREGSLRATWSMDSENGMNAIIQQSSSKVSCFHMQTVGEDLGGETDNAKGKTGNEEDNEEEYYSDDDDGMIQHTTSHEELEFGAMESELIAKLATEPKQKKTLTHGAVESSDESLGSFVSEADKSKGGNSLGSLWSENDEPNLVISDTVNEGVGNATDDTQGNEYAETEVPPLQKAHSEESSVESMGWKVTTTWSKDSMAAFRKKKKETPSLAPVEEDAGDPAADPTVPESSATSEIRSVLKQPRYTFKKKREAVLDAAIESPASNVDAKEEDGRTPNLEESSCSFATSEATPQLEVAFTENAKLQSNNDAQQNATEPAAAAANITPPSGYSKSESMVTRHPSYVQSDSAESASVGQQSQDSAQTSVYDPDAWIKGPTGQVKSPPATPTPKVRDDDNAAQTTQIMSVATAAVASSPNDQYGQSPLSPSGQHQAKSPKILQEQQATTNNNQPRSFFRHRQTLPQDHPSNIANKKSSSRRTRSRSPFNKLQRSMSNASYASNASAATSAYSTGDRSNAALDGYVSPSLGENGNAEKRQGFFKRRKQKKGSVAVASNAADAAVLAPTTPNAKPSKSPKFRSKSKQQKKAGATADNVADESKALKEDKPIRKSRFLRRTKKPSSPDNKENDKGKRPRGRRFTKKKKEEPASSDNETATEFEHLHGRRQKSSSDHPPITVLTTTKHRKKTPPPPVQATQYQFEGYDHHLASPRVLSPHVSNNNYEVTPLGYTNGVLNVNSKINNPWEQHQQQQRPQHDTIHTDANANINPWASYGSPTNGPTTAVSPPPQPQPTSPFASNTNKNNDGPAPDGQVNLQGSGLPSFKWWTWKQQTNEAGTAGGASQQHQEEEENQYFAFMCMFPQLPK